MTDQDFERREKARQDAMFDAQFADEPTSDVDYADEPQVNGWPLYSGLPQPLQEPVVIDPDGSIRLLKHPPQREWQGLTDEEIKKLRHIIKEKNT